MIKELYILNLCTACRFGVCLFISSFQTVYWWAERLYTKNALLVGTKKCLQNKLEISYLFCKLLCFNLQRICREVTQINHFFPNGAQHVVWKKIIDFVTPPDKYSVSWNKEAYKICRKKFDLFCKRFLLQLRVYFVV